MPAIDLEEAAQLHPVVAAPEAVGAERREAAATGERADLVGEGAHVVGRGDERAGVAVQALLDPRAAWLGRGMQPVPALDLQPLAAQLGEARHAPDVALDAEVLTQQLGTREHLAQDGARAEQLHPRRLRRHRGARTQQVHPGEDALLRAFRQRRLRVRLVEHGEVVEDVLLLAHHPAQAVLDDHRQLVAVGRVVGATVGDRRGEDVRVTVLVLEALAIQRRAARGGADQEAAGTAVAGGPGQVADPLEAEHRVEDVEGDHRLAVIGVGGGGGDPRAHRAGLVDALLEDLAVLVLAVEHQVVGVLRLVQLADLTEDAELPEHALHAEGARLVRDDRHHAATNPFVAHERIQDTDKRHGRGVRAVTASLQDARERAQRRHLERGRIVVAHRQRAAQGRSALPEIDQLGRVVGGPEEACLGRLIVVDRQLEAVADRQPRRPLDRLLLVRDVLALARLAHAEALDRLGENDGGLPLRVGRGSVGGVHLLRVVTATGERPDLIVGPVGDHRGQLRVLAEEELAHVGAALGLERLVLAVHRLLHAPTQPAARVGGEQRVPG